jgi:AcrR family transcriptional regulator
MDQNDPRCRILEKATEKFFSIGYSRVTMDEMADELGMSKKTLYKYFRTKSDLLREIVMQFIQGIIREQDRILSDESLEFEARLVELMRVIARVVGKVSQSFMRDVQRSAPEVWETVEETRQQRIQLIFGRLLSEGQQKGLVRADLNHPFLVFMLSAMIRETLTPNVVSQFSVSFVEAFETVRFVFLGGVLTDRGRERFFNANSFAGIKPE